MSLSNQVLRLGPDKLLLQNDEPSALGLLALELSNLVGDLGLAVTAGLDALLRVADLLEHAAALVEGVGVRVLLLAQLAQHHAHLVADVAKGLIAGLLAPLGQLCRDRHPLLSSGLVRVDQVVVRLDQPVQLARQLRLHVPAQRREREALAPGAAGVAGRALVRADRQCSVPAVVLVDPGIV